MAQYVGIDGTIIGAGIEEDKAVDVIEEDFFPKFIEWVESNGYLFAGATYQYDTELDSEETEETFESVLEDLMDAVDTANFLAKSNDQREQLMRLANEILRVNLSK